MVLVLDNYDSFTYNLVQYFGELGAEVTVRRNDRTTIDEIEKMQPERICISPGPGTPDDAGISNDVIRHFGPRIPVLGVCLGHQCIGQVFGGEVVRAAEIMHGKTSLVRHHDVGVFAGLPNPLEITAETDDGTIMGLRHRDLDVEGVQFHPESILTAAGHDLIATFLARA